MDTQTWRCTPNIYSIQIDHPCCGDEDDDDEDNDNDDDDDDDDDDNDDDEDGEDEDHDDDGGGDDDEEEVEGGGWGVGVGYYLILSSELALGLKYRAISLIPMYCTELSAHILIFRLNKMIQLYSSIIKRKHKLIHDYETNDISITW